MEARQPLAVLPPIPAKRYFTIGEVSELCAVKPHVLRYWEQEFSQLRPMKRRGNRRYYQHHEVLLVRKIRELLYEQGFTISGARNQLMEGRLNGVSASAATSFPTGLSAAPVGDSINTGAERLPGGTLGDPADSVGGLRPGGSASALATGAAALGTSTRRAASAQAELAPTFEAASARLESLRADLEAILELLKPSATRL
jgi:DNA-binding transcriptional MerR regulator